MTRLVILLAALATIGCGGDLPTAPAGPHDIVCPLGCVLPPGCRTEPSPPERPRGYKVICDGPR